MTRIALVTGGTGTIGSLVVPRLREAGYAVRVLSRQHRAAADGIELVTGDLATGAGIDAAVAEAEIIVHCAGSMKGDEAKARNLVQSAARIGTPHIVYISVVGADRVPVASGIDRVMFGYFAAKLAGEHIIAESGLPWTTLRATQTHDLVLMTARQMAKLPVIPVPGGFKFQPVDSREVAARLAELALGTPQGLVPDIAGPRIYELKALIHSYLQATHRRRPIIAIWLPGKAAHAIRDGVNLAPDRAVGMITWEEFLADRLKLAGENRVALHQSP